jgi:hypothetical protein
VVWLKTFTSVTGIINHPRWLDGRAHVTNSIFIVIWR